MKIWHQSFTVLEDLPAYADAMKAHIRKVVRPDTEVVMHGQLRGTYPGNYPGTDLGYAALYQMHGIQWVVQALKAEREQFDAYAMATLPNPLIREIRTLVDMPVVGYGEASMHMACMLGHRFGLLIFIDRMAPLFHEQIAGYGLPTRCAGVRPVGFTFQDVLAAFSDPTPLLERFHASARALIAAGADVIVPGEMPMNILLASNGITQVDGVPVIDGLAVTLKLTECMVELRQSIGLRQSRHGFFGEAPDPARVSQVLSFYGLDTLADR
ncbi:MAG: aspartate/glutamate racemase family protein [Polaromonas sp.]|nr:aspartate/glutamate racemase family protein [Polaromonas sp.]